MEKHKNKCFNVFQNKRLILVFFGDCGFGEGIALTLSDWNAALNTDRLAVNGSHKNKHYYWLFWPGSWTEETMLESQLLPFYYTEFETFQMKIYI